MPSQDQVDRVANLSDAQADIFSDVSILHLPRIRDRFRARLPVTGRYESCIASVQLLNATMPQNCRSLRRRPSTRRTRRWRGPSWAMTRISNGTKRRSFRGEVVYSHLFAARLTHTFLAHWKMHTPRSSHRSSTLTRNT